MNDQDWLGSVAFTAPNGDEWIASGTTAVGAASTDGGYPQMSTCTVQFQRFGEIRAISGAPLNWKQLGILETLFERADPTRPLPELIYFNDAVQPMPSTGNSEIENATFGRWRRITLSSDWLREFHGDPDAHEGPYHFFAHNVVVRGATVATVWARREEAEDAALLIMLGKRFDAPPNKVRVSEETPLRSE